MIDVCDRALYQERFPRALTCDRYGLARSKALHIPAEFVCAVNAIGRDGGDVIPDA
jgi:hypothetical protein